MATLAIAEVLDMIRFATLSGFGMLVISATIFSAEKWACKGYRDADRRMNRVMDQGALKV